MPPHPQLTNDTGEQRCGEHITCNQSKEIHVDHSTTMHYVEEAWDQSVLPALSDYIEIPNKSPAFDRDWEANGHMDYALGLLTEWTNMHAASGAELEVLRLPSRTPLIFIDVPGE